MAQESTFLMYVRHTFKRWSGLQEAINDGMGGPYAKEKEIWIGTEVENYFKKYTVVEPDDIEEYIGAMIENEFDTYFEDGSLQEVSKNFCTAYPISLVNPDHGIFQEMQKKTISTLTQSPSVVLQTNKNQETPEEATCKQMEKLAVTDIAGADGWTTVTKKSKKQSEKMIPA